jgi:hypothetical protein
MLPPHCDCSQSNYACSDQENGIIAERANLVIQTSTHHKLCGKCVRCLLSVCWWVLNGDRCCVTLISCVSDGMCNCRITNHFTTVFL